MKLNEVFVRFKWYVGVKDSKFEPFRVASVDPETIKERFPEYEKLVGPFSTQRGAHYWTKFTKEHPNSSLSILDAEHAAKKHVNSIKHVVTETSNFGTVGLNELRPGDEIEYLTAVDGRKKSVLGSVVGVDKKSVKVRKYGRNDVQTIHPHQVVKIHDRVNVDSEDEETTPKGSWWADPEQIEKRRLHAIDAIVNNYVKNFIDFDRARVQLIDRGLSEEQIEKLLVKNK